MARPPGVEPPPAGTDRIPGFDGMSTRPAPPVLTNVVPGELVLIPAGAFWMGNDAVPDEAPRRRLELPAYQIEKTEVTIGQFKKFVSSGGYEDRAHWSADGWTWKQRFKVTAPDLELTDERPMVYCSYHEAEAYAHWAGRRLPTEEEWEKAARGTDGRDFPWGNSHDPTLSNHWLYKRMPIPLTIMSWPAASYPPGASPYGLLHMAGNVWEWTSSTYRNSSYRSSSWASSPATSPWKAIRGGSWMNLLSFQTTTHREPAPPHQRRSTLGFRCVKDVGKAEKGGTP